MGRLTSPDPVPVIDAVRFALLSLSEAAKTDEQVAEFLRGILVAAVLSNARASDRTPRALLEAHFKDTPDDDAWRADVLPSMDAIAAALGREETT